MLRRTHFGLQSLAPSCQKAAISGSQMVTDPIPLQTPTFHLFPNANESKILNSTMSKLK